MEFFRRIELKVRRVEVAPSETVQLFWLLAGKPQERRLSSIREIIFSLSCQQSTLVKLTR